VKLLILFLSFLTATSFAAPADRDGDLGLGVMVGDTTSLTGKYWTESDRGWDLSGGASEEKEGWLQASYLKHYIGAFGAGTRFIGESTPYAGLGLGMGFNRTQDAIKRQNDYFARIPLGLSWMPNRTPVDLFAEVAPTYIFSPGGVVYLSGNVGGRYYF